MTRCFGMPRTPRLSCTRICINQDVRPGCGGVLDVRGGSREQKDSEEELRSNQYDKQYVLGASTRVRSPIVIGIRLTIVDDGALAVSSPSIHCLSKRFSAEEDYGLTKKECACYGF